MTSVVSSHRFAPLPFMLAGLIVWLTRFVAVYLVAEAICGRGWQDASIGGLGMLPGFIVASAIVAVAIDGWIIAAGVASARQSDRSSMSRFASWVGVAVAATSIVAIIWETVPAFVLPVCR